LHDEAERWGNFAQLAAEYETILAAAQQNRWAALVRSCPLPEPVAEQVLSSDAFGPMCAELRRMEANGYQPEGELPRLVAARSLGNAADPAAVLHHRVAVFTDRAKPAQRRQEQRYICGLIPEASGPMAEDMRVALDQRADRMRERAEAIVRRAVAQSAPWLAALGSRPADPAAAARWQQAAYRDRWNITSPEPLGTDQPSAIQKADAARVHALAVQVSQRRQTPATAAPMPLAQSGPAL
ncbi:MAG: conjugal transfer protein, partial [Propionibacteriaceae bacterium]|nr:conjugal transfer protein [Propionibacteriaceae bacterium]